ncbi:MAG: ribose-5-phosphate isomerase RpiA [Paenibacillus dendritiformis]|uniref:ribose-5-phosphate isomerase RpiA n=1 Tax=Paenibacillus dendritiformis TaxID=130049 RepID=UPI00143D9A82|nr:ribose-5-phosphate isomerase RpiA [Paenibacillus dendritiformis]MDU5143964.1 ribose-5-phosphate isomerase RpiA [Paenibacillus dendritiformis]NKI20614.1 ribose-5-phosphate isomerase RpiA [Paenibacillus dendritiformis]NRF96499.1 ribose-5-phosphate isomerase RpiA [Paenibacillus dendritiformis]GIO70529.1 ribose-5-phosphate isomerase A [Paenibacillus dendritiformis]
MEAKRAAAEEAVKFIRDGMTVGLGTGSTAYWAIQAIGARVAEGLRIQAVPTSEATERLARECGIPLLDKLTELDVTIDGADEVDGRLNAIKGGGGALLREKLVAAASRELILIVDHSKCVAGLGGFPLPVEIVPFGAEVTMRQIGRLGCRPVLREKGGRPFVTDNGNYIADCAFGRIAEPGELQHQLKRITGVVDHGLFIGMADKLIIGHGSGAVTVREREENDTTKGRET